MNDFLKLPPITVPARDYSRLMRTARELAEQCHPLAAPLLQELHRATVCTADELPADVVTLDTFVTYRMGGQDTPDKRMLIHPDDHMWPPAELSVLSPVGLSLLGLRAGHRIPVIGSALASDACVEVEAVGPRVTGAFVPFGTAPPDGTGTRWT
ncbi:GreA/GreB family elongation factor [Microvirga arabica]|uniref:GreA/GreB family elongation factor n=1 Tax=Microvirga arabica TaxID=1128671 RepID=UPI0019397DDC|nr:GreA/GreB family elongation factor [Microvirga arabica]MBM1173520.1 GreA/GreB family elongation factor [Microvirga arabica]